MAVAVSAAIEIVQSRDTTGVSRAVGAELAIAVSRPWYATGARLHVEVGLETEGAGEIEAILFNAAAEHAVAQHVIAEVAWNGRAVAGSINGAVVPAVEWRPGGGRADGIAAAVGVPVGLMGASARWGLIAHLELEF